TTGTNGTNGATGATGPAGTPGTNAINGAPGPTGPTGIAGTNGTNGTNGATGPTGATGATGATGELQSFTATGVLFADSNGTATTATGQIKLLNSLSGKNAELSAGGDPVQEGYNFVGYGGASGPYGGPGMLLKTGEDDQSSTLSLQAGSNQLVIERLGPSGANNLNQGFPHLADGSSIGDEGNGLVLYAMGNNHNGASGKLLFGTGTNGIGSEKMRLDANGSLGIGTSTPSAKLDVNGSIAVAGSPVIDANGNWVGNPTGLAGATGPTGPTGTAGINGTNGATGATGPTGLSGSPGTNGTNGAT